MSQGQLTKVFDSGSVSQFNNNLHVQDVILPDFGCNGMIFPMRFELVKDDPIFTKISGNLAVFRDIICLPRRHHTLVKKVLKNLHCRLDRECPKRPHWYFPWRKSQDLDFGLRFYITYQMKGFPYNTIELNEANWPDLYQMFHRCMPKEAVFRVNWWVKGERIEYSVDSGKEEAKEDTKEFWKEDDVESWEDSVESPGQAW
jgi:hypothetical protein